jgi:hypothetical protein
VVQATWSSRFKIAGSQFGAAPHVTCQRMANKLPKLLVRDEVAHKVFSGLRWEYVFSAVGLDGLRGEVSFLDKVTGGEISNVLVALVCVSTAAPTAGGEEQCESETRDAP